jgi:hypothetical protein
MPIVGVTKIAGALNLEVRRVQQLVRPNAPPAGNWKKDVHDLHQR